MLKNHSELKAMAAKNPNAEDIYVPSLIDNFYPTRLSELENVCLYDFVDHYKYDGTDKNGESKYRKLTKHVLTNHKIFNPLQEEERVITTFILSITTFYYYTLLLLFCYYYFIIITLLLLSITTLLLLSSNTFILTFTKP